MSRWREILDQRQATAAQFQSTAADVQARMAQMNRWKSRLEKTVESQANTPAAKDASVAGLRRRINKLSSYDNRSLEQQRQLLI